MVFLQPHFSAVFLALSIAVTHLPEPRVGRHVTQITNKTALLLCLNFKKRHRDRKWLGLIKHCEKLKRIPMGFLFLTLLKQF